MEHRRRREKAGGDVEKVGGVAEEGEAHGLGIRGQATGGVEDPELNGVVAIQMSSNRKSAPRPWWFAKSDVAVRISAQMREGVRCSIAIHAPRKTEDMSLGLELVVDAGDASGAGDRRTFLSSKAHGEETVADKPAVDLNVARTTA